MPSDPLATRKGLGWGTVLLVLAAVVGVYYPGLSGGFILDDYPHIVRNQLIKADSLELGELAKALAAFRDTSLGRPLATLSLAIDHAIWGGLEPFGFKLTNLLLHLVNTALVFALCNRLFSLPEARVRGNSRWLALAACALWALHPLQVSTVLYPIQRMEMLAATSLLAATLIYLRGRAYLKAGTPHGWILIGISGLVAATGLLSKETALVFPLLTLVIELTLLKFECLDNRHRTWLRYMYAAGVGLGLLLLLSYLLPQYSHAEAFANRDFTASERVLTQFRVMWMYVGQAVAPLPSLLVFNYDHIEPSRSLTEPASTLVGMAAFLATLALVTFLRARLPLLAAGVGFFLAAHALTCAPLPLELAFEHRNYLPLLGLTVSAIAFADCTIRGRMLYAATSLAVIALATLAFPRTLTWGNEAVLVHEHVANNPMSPRASNDLGVFLAEIAQRDSSLDLMARAMHEFERGRTLPRSSIMAEQALILLASRYELPVRDEWWDSLRRKIRNGPTGPQDINSMLALLRERINGTPVDDNKFIEAWLELETYAYAPGFATVAFGHYAIELAGDREGAALAFALALERSNRDPVLVRDIRERLVDLEELELAEELGVLQPGGN